MPSINFPKQLVPQSILNIQITQDIPKTFQEYSNGRSKYFTGRFLEIFYGIYGCAVVFGD